MSIQSYIEYLRNKPEHVRTRYAFWGSFTITAVIFVFWISSFTNGILSKASSTASVPASKVSSPSQTMIAGVGSFFNDIKDLIFSPKKIEYSDLNVSPGNK